MKSLNIKGPFDLTQEVIDSLIPEGCPGNYAYGYLNDNDNSFVVKYVGRPDSNLKERIRHGIGKYPLFKFSLANNANEAFNKECINYHDFGGDKGLLDNDIHPDRPENGLAFCPICTKRIMNKIKGLG